MPAENPLCDILEALHQNQLALADAVESVGLWIDQRGGTEASSTILGLVSTIDVNASVIKCQGPWEKRKRMGNRPTPASTAP